MDIAGCWLKQQQQWRIQREKTCNPSLQQSIRTGSVTRRKTHRHTHTQTHTLVSLKFTRLQLPLKSDWPRRNLFGSIVFNKVNEVKKNGGNETVLSLKVSGKCPTAFWRPNASTGQTANEYKRLGCLLYEYVVHCCRQGTVARLPLLRRGVARQPIACEVARFRRTALPY